MTMGGICGYIGGIRSGIGVGENNIESSCMKFGKKNITKLHWNSRTKIIHDHLNGAIKIYLAKLIAYLQSETWMRLSSNL